MSECVVVPGWWSVEGVGVRDVVGQNGEILSVTDDGRYVHVTVPPHSNGFAAPIDAFVTLLAMAGYDVKRREGT